jgi:hypothetical protein
MKESLFQEILSFKFFMLFDPKNFLVVYTLCGHLLTIYFIGILLLKEVFKYSKYGKDGRHEQLTKEFLAKGPKN